MRPERWLIRLVRVHRLSTRRREVNVMLCVGVDWAEAQHAACLMDAGGRVIRRLTVAHTAAGLKGLHAAIRAVEPAPAEVQVAIERPDGLLVEGLLAAGYVVYALNPKAVERYRERTRVAGGKTDPADAELLARILVTDRDRHQALQPNSAQVERSCTCSRARTRSPVAISAACSIGCDRICWPSSRPCWRPPPPSAP
jgi:transposase